MRGLEDLSSLNIGHQKTAKYVTISVCIGTMVFGTCNNLWWGQDQGLNHWASEVESDTGTTFCPHHHPKHKNLSPSLPHAALLLSVSTPSPQHLSPSNTSPLVLPIVDPIITVQKHFWQFTTKLLLLTSYIRLLNIHITVLQFHSTNQKIANSINTQNENAYGAPLINLLPVLWYYCSLVMWAGKIVRKISYFSGKFPKISIVFFRKISNIFSIIRILVRER